MQIGSSVQLSSLAQVWYVPGPTPSSRTCCVGDGTTRVLQRGKCLVLPPSTLDPVNPAGVLETLPPGIPVVCSSWSMVKFVSQYSLYLPGSQVMFILSMLISVDTAARFSPPFPFPITETSGRSASLSGFWSHYNFFSVVVGRFLGDNVVFSSGTFLLYLYGYIREVILLDCDVCVVLQTQMFKVLSDKHPVQT